ncbi:hypothetical protein D5F01_LYC04780 [Larimichthys crocea]|uniref:Uncharacterized protein n=1 Tax=Larimichthys crocea TaxID=215358 RepID=A0A6G0IX61_LARCR|nr:hypothetical protein D5F01_LYC04780 [Larimichthys crocea]
MLMTSSSAVCKELRGRKEYSLMDTPESPTQSPQSPEEEEKGLSDSELLDSPDDEEDRLISDRDIVHDEENGNGALGEEDEEELESRGRGSELERRGKKRMRWFPDFVSDPEDDEPGGEIDGIGQEDGTIMLMEGDEDGPQWDQLDGEEERKKRSKRRESLTPHSLQTQSRNRARASSLKRIEKMGRKDTVITERKQNTSQLKWIMRRRKIKAKLGRKRRMKG